MKQACTRALSAVIRQAPPAIAQFLATQAKAVITRRDLGPTYQKVRRQIRRVENATDGEIRALQLKLCQEIVSYAWEHCPGYRDYWRQHGFTPEQLVSYQDIRRIPEISKQQMQEQLDRFSAQQQRPRKYITTSGSTGIPLGLYLDRTAEATELAFLHDIWERRGFSPNYRSVILRGAAVRGGYQGNPYAELTLFGDLLLSAYHINRETAPMYLEAIRQFNPGVLQAYPSALVQLTQACRDIGITMKSQSITSIILASEKLYSFDKELLQKFWQTPLVHYYGMTEKVILAGPCQESDVFHVYPQYGLTEVLRDDGSEAEEGELGHLVGTSFFMKETPFIRYRTGDLAVKGKNFCPACKRHYLLLKEIAGREAEYILTSAGRKIPFSMAIGSVHNDLFCGLEQFQFIQYTPGELWCTYVAPTELNVCRQQAIADELKRKLGEGVQLSFRKVSAVPKNTSGKFSFFQNLLGGD